MSKFTIAIHGGAGTISKKSMTTEKEAAYIKALNEALAKKLWEHTDKLLKSKISYCSSFSTKYSYSSSSSVKSLQNVH